MSNFIGSIDALTNSLYGNFRTRTFTDIYPEFLDFLKDYNINGIPPLIKQDSVRTLF